MSVEHHQTSLSTVANSFRCNYIQGVKATMLIVAQRIPVLDVGLTTIAIKGRLESAHTTPEQRFGRVSPIVV